MNTVYKYPVPITDGFYLELPAGAKVLSFQVQGGGSSPYIWVLVDTERPKVRRYFRVAGTGHPIENAPADLRFIGTIQLSGGALIFHLFEILQ